MPNEHPEIPHGMYCYDTIKADDGTYTRRICPHWERKCINGVPGAQCKLLNMESSEEDMNLIWDQVKYCGINSEFKD